MRCVKDVCVVDMRLVILSAFRFLSGLSGKRSIIIFMLNIVGKDWFAFEYACMAFMSLSILRRVVEWTWYYCSLVGSEASCSDTEYFSGCEDVVTL